MVANWLGFQEPGEMESAAIRAEENLTGNQAMSSFDVPKLLT